MASNQQRWIKDFYGDTVPLKFLGLFQAGSTQAIKRGELMEYTGDSNTAWVPIDSDHDMTTYGVSIAAEEIKAGDLAGYYDVILSRPGDVFEFDLATAAGTVLGTAMTYSSSEAVTTGGSNAIGHSVGIYHYPKHQGHRSDDASGDRGVTVRTVSQVHMTIEATNSYLAKLIVP